MLFGLCLGWGMRQAAPQSPELRALLAVNINDLGGKLWNLCHVLRDDGIVYHKYLSELSYLLFLKIAEETNAEDDLPVGCRWDDLRQNAKPGMVGFYRIMLTRLGEDVGSEKIRRIFSFPTTVFSHDENLIKVFKAMDGLDWASFEADQFGDLYEYLLEKASTEVRAGAGQYFTPRPLVDCLVRLMKPRPGEVIQDPAAGTGGFLVSAQRFLQDAHKGATATFEGVEIERDTYRLCLMNFFLHGMNGRMINGDALTRDADELHFADLILANPPFGSTGGGARARRSDLIPTSNKQLLFLQHIYRGLKPGGRAAVVVPDNVLFEAGVGRRVRRELLETCDLHTILRLPAGIFYATGVNTVVLMFAKHASHSSPGSNRLWTYDLRSSIPKVDREHPFSSESLADFRAFYGDDPLGRSPRPDTGEHFYSTTREAVVERDYDLDLFKHETPIPDAYVDPGELAAAIAGRLREALAEIEELATDLTALRSTSVQKS